MLRYAAISLSPDALAWLAARQARVDALPTHAEKVELASDLFKSKTGTAFLEVKAALAAEAPGGGACFYCERDRYRDIEHVRPKRHYPQHCFDWFNYVYACTICNQDRKKDKFAVFDSAGAVIEFDRTLPITAPVPVGSHVLLDIRAEDPMEFLQLDFSTGFFVPIGNDMARVRGKYTRDLFGLNDAGIVRQRKEAYRNFKEHLGRYQQAKERDDLAAETLARDELLTLSHPTVLVEMRRQALMSEELRALFEGVPADIGARS